MPPYHAVHLNDQTFEGSVCSVYIVATETNQDCRIVDADEVREIIRLPALPDTLTPHVDVIRFTTSRLVAPHIGITASGLKRLIETSVPPNETIAPAVEWLKHKLTPFLEETSATAMEDAENAAALIGPSSAVHSRQKRKHESAKQEGDEEEEEEEADEKEEEEEEEKGSLSESELASNHSRTNKRIRQVACLKWKGLEAPIYQVGQQRVISALEVACFASPDPTRRSIRYPMTGSMLVYYKSRNRRVLFKEGLRELIHIIENQRQKKPEFIEWLNTVAMNEVDSQSQGGERKRKRVAAPASAATSTANDDEEVEEKEEEEEEKDNPFPDAAKQVLLASNPFPNVTELVKKAKRVKEQEEREVRQGTHAFVKKCLKVINDWLKEIQQYNLKPLEAKIDTVAVSNHVVQLTKELLEARNYQVLEDRRHKQLVIRKGV